MVVALEPEREVQYPEHLQSLAEARRAIARNSLEHRRDILATDAQSLLTVAGRERDNIVDSALAILIGGLAESQKSVLYRLFVVGREV